jgi:hypothetical protein
MGAVNKEMEAGVCCWWREQQDGPAIDSGAKVPLVNERSRNLMSAWP